MENLENYNPVEKAYQLLLEAKDGSGFTKSPEPREDVYLYDVIEEVIGYLGEALAE